MGGSNATKSVSEGAKTIVWLATASEKKIPLNGVFYKDEKYYGSW